MGGVHLASIVRYFALLYDLAAAGRTERLDGEVLALFHFCGIVVLDQKNRLSAVDLVKVNRVTAEVLYWLD